MANETRLGREGVVVAKDHPAANTDTILGREGVVAASVRSGSTIDMQLYRIGVYVLKSRPHGWGTFDDPPL